MPVTPELDYSHALISPGQGNQKIGMGHDLARKFPEAAVVWVEADTALKPQLGRNFTGIVWAGTEEELTLTQNAQPAIIIDSYARSRVFKVLHPEERPGWHGGMSLGFVTSLVTSGALSPEGAIMLGKGRGEAFRYAIDHSPKTTMVALTELDVEIIDDVVTRFGLVYCLVNEDIQVVVGGELDPMAKATEYLTGKGFGENVHPLVVDAAFHSRYMEAAVPMYERVVADLPLTAPTEGRLVGASTVTELVTPADIRRELILQLTTTDKWRDAMHFLRDQGVTRMTELNGDSRLATMNRRMFKGLISRVEVGNGFATKAVDGIEKEVEKKLTVVCQWVALEAIRVAGGSDDVPREDVAVWYLQTVAKRTGMEEEELSGDTHFVDDANMDSEDLKWLRAQVRAKWGRNVSDEEAKSILTIGAAIDATYRLVNS